MSENNQEMEKKRNRKPRTRMKQVYSKIREQMEFYFSDANLHKDRFLKKSIIATSDGYIPVDTFLQFNKIKYLTDEASVLVAALDKKSDLLEVNEAKTHVRRTTEIKEPVNIDERTVYVEHLPQSIDHEWVKKLFSACGKVVYVSLPRYNSTGDLKGFAFVEFETVEGAKSACEELNNPPVNLSDSAGMFPKSSHQLEAIKKKLPEDQIKATQEKALQVLHTEQEADKDQAGGEPVFKEETIPAVKQEQTNYTKVLDKGKRASTEDATVKASSLKRPRTASEDHTDSDNISGAEFTNSPAKRKRSEVTFIIPQDLKADEGKEKTTPAAKKKAKKRKNRSKSSDDHVVVEEGEAGKGGAAKEKVKKAKLDADEKRDVTAETIKKEEPTTDSVESGSTQKLVNKENKKKRRFRCKKPREAKEVPELRVIPKKEWLVLREEYLQLQKTSMAMLKKTLGDVKLVCTKDEGKSKHKEIEFLANVIVKVTAQQPIKRNELKVALGEGVQIAYVDVRDENQSGFIRCKDASSAKTISDAQLDGHTFTMVSGDDETQYWQKLSCDREAKLSNKARHKKRGYQKWMDKAQKASIDNSEKKHIVFDDDA